MNNDESFLHQETAELERFLLGHARRDRAPRAAHERALAGLASVSRATGLSASAWGASAASPATPWLIAKWIAVGMSASLLTFGTAEGLYGAFGAQQTSAHEPSTSHDSSASRTVAGRRRRRTALRPVCSSAFESPSSSARASTPE